jgi:ABC-type nitrate/sulfonate/bicarbonate transport system substrate-binding protein
MTPYPLTRRRFGTAAAVATLTLGPALAQAVTPLRVKVFPGAQNLPLLAAQSRGFFKTRGLDVTLLFTQNSDELRGGLARGEFDIAHAAVDNAVAMRDVAGHDIVIMIGGDNSMNELFVQSDVADVAQLRGRTLIVDAPNTAYALQAKKILLRAGLQPGDYQVKQVGGTFQRVKAMIDDRANSASTLNPPFSIQARQAGLKSLGRISDLLGPYQASGAFAMRPWATAHGEAIERYLMAYIEGVRWSLNPTNASAATALLVAGLQLSPEVAALTYAALTDPTNGLTPDARLDPQGFANVLALRAEIEGGSGAAPDPGSYVDLRWYDAALARLAR